MNKNIAIKKSDSHEYFDHHEVKFILGDLQATRQLAELLAQYVRIGDILCLKGELGSGKTAFAKAFINNFFDKREEVLSPSFGLVQIFSAPQFVISHYDLYRVKNPEELEEIGLEEAFTHGVTLIEWPEIIGSRLPEDHVELTFDYMGSDEESRIVSITGYGFWQVLLKEIFN